MDTVFNAIMFLLAVVGLIVVGMIVLCIFASSVLSTAVLFIGRQIRTKSEISTHGVCLNKNFAAPEIIAALITELAALSFTLYNLYQFFN